MGHVIAHALDLLERDDEALLALEVGVRDPDDVLELGHCGFAPEPELGTAEKPRSPDGKALLPSALFTRAIP